jgi:hypothetical protein
MPVAHRTAIGPDHLAHPPLAYAEGRYRVHHAATSTASVIFLAAIFFRIALASKVSASNPFSLPLSYFAFHL